MPNALIVPIGPGGRANPGSLVLTASSSRAGIRRALVVRGGTETEPSVLFLDAPLPAAGQRSSAPELLPRGTFRVLDEPGDPGTSLACFDRDRAAHFVVLRRSSNGWLALGFGGLLRTWGLDQCQPLPLRPTLESGARAFVPVVGRYQEASVERVDSGSGSVAVSYALAGKRRTAVVPLLDVAQRLPRPAR